MAPLKPLYCIMYNFNVYKRLFIIIIIYIYIYIYNENGKNII